MIFGLLFDEGATKNSTSCLLTTDLVSLMNTTVLFSTLFVPFILNFKRLNGSIGLVGVFYSSYGWLHSGYPRREGEGHQVS